MQMGEAALSVMRAEADKFLVPEPNLAVPRGSPVGVSPEPLSQPGMCRVPVLLPPLP